MKPSFHITMILALPSNISKAVTAQELAEQFQVRVAAVEESLRVLRASYLVTKLHGKWNLTVRGNYFRNSLVDLKLI